MRFMGKLKRSKVAPEGQLSKRDALSAALKFLKVNILVDASHPLYSKASHTEQVLAGWKNTLRKLKRKFHKSKLQKLSSEPMSLDETTLLLNSKVIWVHFNQTCLEAERCSVWLLHAGPGHYCTSSKYCLQGLEEAWFGHQCCICRILK